MKTTLTLGIQVIKSVWEWFYPKSSYNRPGLCQISYIKLSISHKGFLPYSVDFSSKYFNEGICMTTYYKKLQFPECISCLTDVSEDLHEQFISL